MPAHHEPSNTEPDTERELHVLVAGDAAQQRHPAGAHAQLQEDLSASGSALDIVNGVPAKLHNDLDAPANGMADQYSASGSDEGKNQYAEKKQNVLRRIVNVVIPSGGLLSGVFNLASVTLGAGIMSIPSSFNTSGMLMAIFYLVVITALTVFSITLLSIAMEKTKIFSFEGLARALFGRGGDIIVAALMWLLCFGGAVGYVIAVGNIFTQIFDHAGVPQFLQENGGRRCIVSGIWLFFMLPLVLPKKINSLRYVSAVGVTFIIFFVICIIYHSAANGFKNGVRKDLVMASKGNNGVSGLSIFMFSYLCQVNVGRIIVENKNSCTRKITMQALISCCVCGTLYFLAGFFGYAEFGPTLSGNIINKYDPYASPVFFVVFLGLIVKLCAAFSLNMLACRTALFNVVQWDVETMPYWKHTIVSVSFAVGALILGLFVPDIDVVFGLVGAFCGGFIGFVFPALFVMYAGNWSFSTVGVWYYLSTYLLLLCGVIAIVFGTGSSIYGTVMKYS